MKFELLYRFARRRSREWMRRAIRIAVSLGVVSAILAIAFRIHGLRNATIVLTLMFFVVLFSIRWGRLEAMLASIVSAVGFGVWFQAPVGYLHIDDPEGWVAVLAFVTTALLVSALAAKARERAAEALERQKETERLYDLGKALLVTDSLQTVAWTVTNRLIPIFGVKAASFYFQESGETHRSGSEAHKIDEGKLREVALSQQFWVDTTDELAIVPLSLGGESVGSLGVSGGVISEGVLKAIGQLIVVVLERVRALDSLVKTNQALELKHQEAAQQRERSESLLLNILPAEIADELRRNGMVSPKYFEDVTIMFLDFVGFTLSTEQLAAEDLVQVLHEYFTAFDRIVARYGLEKMKTIGDSYMCISGLPIRNPSHPVDTVLAAFEMLREVTKRDRPENAARWKVRIGIHTGPVIAGVVGINKFAFDIWGDTVNYSARMEASGFPNRINISERAYSRVKDFFECEHRGKVLTKEKRELDMYFVNAVQERLLDSTGQSPPPAFLRRYHIYFQKRPPAFPEFLAKTELSTQ